MPYIRQERRRAIDSCNEFPCDAGELNYRITTGLLKFDDSAHAFQFVHGLLNEYEVQRAQNYHNYNEIIGVLMCAAFEFDRRAHDVRRSMWLLEIAKEFYGKAVGPYEDTKISANGDIPYV